MSMRRTLLVALCLAGCGGSSGSPADAGSDAGTDAGTDGGACTDDTGCASGSYCAGAGCGTPGACAARPASCPPQIAQVCGCDSNLYSNSCQAFVAGTRVFATGACPTAQCTGVFNQIEALVQGTQSCSHNGDCVIDRVPCGIAHCWAALNTSSDGQLTTLSESYSGDSCGATVVCDCSFLPQSASCDAGLCVPG